MRDEFVFCIRGRDAGPSLCGPLIQLTKRIHRLQWPLGTLGWLNWSYSIQGHHATCQKLLAWPAGNLHVHTAESLPSTPAELTVSVVPPSDPGYHGHRTQAEPRPADKRPTLGGRGLVLKEASAFFSALKMKQETSISPTHLKNHGTTRRGRAVSSWLVSHSWQVVTTSTQNHPTSQTKNQGN